MLNNGPTSGVQREFRSPKRVDGPADRRRRVRRDPDPSHTFPGAGTEPPRSQHGSSLSQTAQGSAMAPSAAGVGCTNLPRAPIARISMARVSSRRGSTFGSVR